MLRSTQGLLRLRHDSRPARVFHPGDSLALPRVTSTLVSGFPTKGPARRALPRARRHALPPLTRRVVALPRVTQAFFCPLPRGQARSTKGYGPRTLVAATLYPGELPAVLYQGLRYTRCLPPGRKTPYPGRRLALRSWGPTQDPTPLTPGGMYFSGADADLFVVPGTSSPRVLILESETNLHPTHPC